MYYRTRTYIAGGWDENKEAIEQLYKWNNSERWALDFSDAHELTQSRDTSLPCTIKESLRVRLAASKTFVLVVGSETDGLRKGGCQYCKNFCPGFSSFDPHCKSHKALDTRSFIDFECEIAAKSFWMKEMKVVVLYDAFSTDKAKCPRPLRDIGIHLPMKTHGFNGACWNYQKIKTAIMD